MTNDLALTSVSFVYPDASVRAVADVTCRFPAGRITALVGSNGCGKSTLLKLLAGVLRPAEGRVTLGDTPLASLSARERARAIGLLFQENDAPSDLTVRDLVLEGRYPHVGFLAQPSPQDIACADEAIAVCGLTALAHRPLAAISSGQRRLAWIAMAVAQKTPWLLLDEPTTYLDVAHEQRVLGLVRRLNADFGLSVILSIHDLNSAAAVADRIVAMKAGSVVIADEARAVLTPVTLGNVFGAQATVIAHPVTGRPVVLWGGEGEG